MTNITIGIAVLFVFWSLSRRESGTALGILIVSMLIWPEFLRVPLGIVQMSVPRLVAILLLIKFVSQGRHRRINYGVADTLVISIWIWTVIATIFADAEFYQVSQMIGRGLDTALMYFVARMAVLNPNDIKKMYWGLGLTALVMCAAGVIEAVTWHSPYHIFNNGNSRIYGFEEVRYGFLRAQGSTLVSIYFGMAMMLITSFIWSARGYISASFVTKAVILSAVLATLSSMSSGPWIALFTLIAMNWYYQKISFIKPTLYALLFMSIMMELLSNRHFYNLIDYIALNSSTAWYRTRLIEVAVSRLEDFWIVGVGSDWPHHWAALLDGRLHIDVVNNFIIIALYGGLPALFMYITVHMIAIKKTIRSFRAEKNIPRRKLLFGLAAALIALDLSSMSVGLYGPALLLSYILLGLLVSVATAWHAVENDRYRVGAI